MTSELELIHTIWDTVTGGESNADSNINERLMRQYISSHRGKSLDVTYKKGLMIPDECFQSLGVVEFTLDNGEYKSSSIPKIIRFKNNEGIMLNKNALLIPVLNSEEYINSKKDKFNKFHPKVKFINNVFTLFLGIEQNCSQIEDLSNSTLNFNVRQLLNEAKQGTVRIEASAVLVRTDDGENYDWKKDPYPMPDELIENLINSVNARDFNIFLQMKSDETGDLRSNVAEHNTREEL